MAGEGFARVEKPLRLLRPVPAYLLLTGSLERGDVNVMAASWVVPTSRRPPRVGVVLDKSSYSLALARKYGWLVIGVVDVTMAELVKFVGTRSGREVDKVGVTGLKIAPSPVDPSIPVPRDALAYLVLHVDSEVDLGPTVLLNCSIAYAAARQGLYRNEGGWDLGRAKVLLHKAKHSFTTPCSDEVYVIRTPWGVAVKKPWRRLFESQDEE
ncbi:MAG: flavin reductase family protein [Desulfurococcales archaeon]|nr:flavin reductase family protein [Desulfurococcales archaeon]